jgi:hypothetical protein
MTIAQQLGRINAAAEMSTRAKEFCTLARIVAMSRGDHALAQHIAEEFAPLADDPQHSLGPPGGLRHPAGCCRSAKSGN